MDENEIKRYKKRPVEIEAVELRNDNIVAVRDWINSNGGQARFLGNGLSISTMEGAVVAAPGYHYVLRGTAGEFYPNRVEIFKNDYDEVGS